MSRMINCIFRTSYQVVCFKTNVSCELISRDVINSTPVNKTVKRSISILRLYGSSFDLHCISTYEYCIIKFPDFLGMKNREENK